MRPDSDLMDRADNADLAEDRLDSDPNLTTSDKRLFMTNFLIKFYDKNDSLISL